MHGSAVSPQRRAIVADARAAGVFLPPQLARAAGDLSPVRLKAIADELEDEIEQLPGVLNVDVLGALEREIRVEVDPDRLKALGCKASRRGGPRSWDGIALKKDPNDPEQTEF